MKTHKSVATITASGRRRPGRGKRRLFKPVKLLCGFKPADQKWVLHSRDWEEVTCGRCLRSKSTPNWYRIEMGLAMQESR